MSYHLQSMVRVIELMLCHDTHKYFDIDTTPQIESLLEKARFLRDSFSNHAILSQEQDSFEDQIRDATQNAEDVLETYAASFESHPLNKKKLLTKFARFACFATEHNISLSDHMHKLHENFDSLKEEMIQILDGARIPDVRASPSIASRVDQNPTNIVIGFEDDLNQLMDRVFGDSSKLEIIPIVGMGGIGKTTLARKVYDDSSVVSHFDARAWATVSNNYTLRDILCGLLGYKRDERAREEDNKLGLVLYQQLHRKRYIIVLDDIWRSNAWDDVKKYFPANNNGSRIILTTRQSNVATYVDSKSPHHQVYPLGEVDSWELLREKVLGEETFLPELEEIVKEIAKSCRGLPLAIQVIGGLLSQTERTKNSWEQVARDINSILEKEDEEVSSILSLSYNNLPCDLKPCFLYMSVFPEDHLIRPTDIMRWWVAEGFLQPIVGKSLEDVAKEHLNALIDRNLIFVRHRTTMGRAKTLGIHDLLRDLCVVKAHESKFFHVIDGRTHHNISQDMFCLRRVSVLTPSGIGDIYGSTRQKPLARSLLNLSNGYLEMVPRDASALQLLRVLEMRRTPFSKALLQVVNLRYLAVICGNELHPGMATFRNLQFLIIWHDSESTSVPQELFEMPHLQEMVSEWSVMLCEFKESKHLVLQENLRTISKLYVSANLYMFLAKRPNLKELGLKYMDGAHPTIVDKSFLQKLEKLDFSGNMGPGATTFLSNFSFPITLKSVSLNSLVVTEACMTTLGMLSNLEILKMMHISFRSSELELIDNWRLSEGKFCRLKYLNLKWMDLVNWECDETHFPILKHIRIEACLKLKNLPSSIGEIPTLERLIVDGPSPAVKAWARKIQEDQLDYGNDLLQVLVD